MHLGNTWALSSFTSNFTKLYCLVKVQILYNNYYYKRVQGKSKSPMKYTDISFSRSTLSWIPGFLFSWFTSSLGVNIPSSSFLEKGTFFDLTFETLQMTLPSRGGQGWGGGLDGWWFHCNSEIQVAHPLFLSSGCKGWSIHFLLSVPFIPRVIPVSFLQTFSSRSNHLNVLDMYPLDYRCACKTRIVILAMWPFCSLLDHPCWQTNMLIFLQFWENAFSWLCFLTVVSPFLCIVLHQNSSKRLSILTNASSLSL